MHLNNSLKKYLHELRMEKKQKRRLASFITAMSVFVSTGVFWQLRGIGTAMTDETPSLNGTDTAAALSAPSGSLCETNEIWESTLPELTDTLAENAALIAASQLGYTENEQNYTLGDDGCTHKNYSRYGAWFGNPYGDWNNMFTCFCLHYAGVNEADIPLSSGCWAWSLKLNEKGVLSPLNRGSPKRGDVLLFDTDLDGKADRSGIISDVAETCFITIEGQVDGAVAECRHSPDDEHIIGYVPVETPENENVSLIEFSAESESGIKVAASAELGVFPDGTEMLATDIPRDEALGKAADALGTGTDEIEAVAVDISFLSPDGVELEPTDSSAVHVEITLPEEQKLSGDEFSLIHISDSGGTEIIENAEVSENGAEFDAERFSIYVITSNGEIEKDRLIIDGNNNYVNNSSDNPYVVTLGSMFTVVGYTTVPPGYNYDQGFLYGWDPKIISRWGDANNAASADSNGYYRREIRFKANKPGNTKVSLDLGNGNYANLYVSVQVPSERDIYVVRWNEEIDKDQLYTKDGATYVTNSQSTPYHINVGETLTLAGYSSVNAWLYMPGNIVLRQDGNTSRTLSYDTDGVNRTVMTVTGQSPGVQDIVLDVDGNNNYRSFWIEVLPSDVNYSNKLKDIYVKTALDDRDIDKVNEFLELFGFPHSDDGYVYNQISTYDGKTKLYPYLLSVGQSAIFYVKDSPTSTMEYKAVKLPIVGTTENDSFKVILGNVSSSAAEVTDDDFIITKTGDGAVNIEAKSSGLYRVTLKDNDSTLRDFYIYVVDSNFKDMTHSDIEISDGGKYTITEVETDASTGIKTTTLWEYDAIISGVNDCFIYDKSDQVIQNYSSANNDYTNIGVAGSTQYEWTSEPSFSGHWDKTFDYSKVSHVVFDVKLDLTPNSKKILVEHLDESNNWIVDTDWTSESWSDSTITIDSVQYDLGEQDMIDAFNKCPNHTGLDFTTRSTGALVQLNAQKELIGRTMQENEFQYELIDSNNGNVIWTSKNKADGNIELFNHTYSSPGRFEYIAREVNNSNDTETLYDSKEYRIIVNVTEKQINDIPILLAEIEYPDGVPKFTNYQTYTLPSTGGGGVVPYMITGSAIIILSFAALLQRKRKEDK